MSKGNLLKYYPFLDVRERAIIQSCLRLVSGKYQGNIHAGILPFVSVRDAVDVLLKVINNNPDGLHGTRIHKQILSKLEYRPEHYAIFHMTLDDTRVYRYFGKHPEAGKPLNFLPKIKVTAGVKWSLPKKAQLPDKDVLVSPAVALHRISKNRWRVEVNSQYQSDVQQWLYSTCS